jgi:hypothetical protein
MTTNSAIGILGATGIVAAEILFSFLRISCGSI